MISKDVLGRRLREVRMRLKMTLKDVEAQSGLSSTHISEIERGMTSPTIGALIRIAHALKKDPSFFIEERELEEICVTTETDRPTNGHAGWVGGRVDPLTVGVLGGRIRAHEVRVDPGTSSELRWLKEGHDACFYCVEGKVLMRVGGRQMTMSPGDSVHGAVPGPPVIEATAAGPGRVLIISDPREDSQ